MWYIWQIGLDHIVDSLTMIYGGYNQVSMIVCALRHLVYGNQCIFSTARNVKTPNITVIESVIVNDCEFLRYKNPTWCILANIIPLEDNTYLCEFVSVKVTSEYLSAFEMNSNGKYITRIAGKRLFFKSSIMCNMNWSKSSQED